MHPNWLAAVLALAFTGVLPLQAQAQSCGAITIKDTFPGGHILERLCDGRRVSGMGSTLTEAQTNLNKFAGLVPTRYCRVADNALAAFPGGFVNQFVCVDPFGAGYLVGGIGSTATDTGENAYRQAQLYTATNDVACRVALSDVSQYVGGFKATANCNRKPGYGAPVISGVGSTATDTGLNVRGFAELLASGNSCFMSGPMQSSGGLFKAVFQCTRGQAIGYGATATAAGNDALMQAQAQ